MEIPTDKVTAEQKKLIDETKAVRVCLISCIVRCSCVDRALCAVSQQLLLEIGKAFGDPFIQNMERIKEVAPLKAHLKDMFTETHRLLLQEQVVRCEEPVWVVVARSLIVCRVSCCD